MYSYRSPAIDQPSCGCFGSRQLQQAEPSFQLCNDNEISLCGMSVAARRDGGGWNQIMTQWDARGNTLEMELLMAQLSINREFFHCHWFDYQR